MWRLLIALAALSPALAGRPPPRTALHQACRRDERRRWLAAARAAAPALSLRGGQDEWSAHQAGDGRWYYYNQATGVSSWKPPPHMAGAPAVAAAPPPSWPWRILRIRRRAPAARAQL